MLPAFSTNLGIPMSDANPGQRRAKRPDWSPFSSMAEATTLRMEYAALSQATGAHLHLRRRLRLRRHPFHPAAASRSRLQSAISIHRSPAARPHAIRPPPHRREE